MTLESTTLSDSPAQPQMITMLVVRGLFYAGLPLKPGDLFEVPVRTVGDYLRTGRAKINNDADRSKVFRQLEQH